MEKIEEFGTRVKELRIKKGVSQEQMALDLGIDQSGLSKIERGARKLKDPIVYEKLKQYLN